MSDIYNYEMGIPCVNPTCKSYGKPHPNCRCTPEMKGMTKEWFSKFGSEGYNKAHPYGANPQTNPAAALTTQSVSGASGPSGPGHENGMYVGAYAKGGEVHFCSYCQPHQKDCEYFSEGGEAGSQFGDEYPTQPSGKSNDEPQVTLAHAAIEHGLLGLLNGELGHSRLADPEKHKKVIDDAKAQYRFRQLAPSADGLQEEGPEASLGTKLADNITSGKHSKSAEDLSGHPLVGSVGKETLEPIMARLSKQMLDNDTNPEAFRGSVDYLNSSARGGKALDAGINKLLEPGETPTHMQESARESSRNELKEKLSSIQSSPGQLLEIGGDLGHYLPEHATHLGILSATAVNYLNSLKPKQTPTAPLDNPPPVDPLAEDNYNRQLDIANHPLILLEHIRNGTLQAQDLATFNTLYPKLGETLKQKIGQEVISAKAKNLDIPYKHMLALSHVLGSPLDGTMTQSSMMAIISSAQGQNQSQQQGSHQSKLSSATQKTLKEVDSLSATPDQARQINRK